ncbi:MAG: hypothetical protein KIT83_14015 [Bryobacterales bacterium]|nr:hypothetical protein [Bryobacterales bacterium]
MRRTRGSLYYVAGYLYFGGAGFLLFPSAVLSLFFAEGIYSMVTLRLLGGVMLGLAILISAIIEQSMIPMYRQTLFARVPVIGTLAYVYYDSLDRMWAILLGIVVAGWLATLICYWQDLREVDPATGHKSSEAPSP